MASNSEQDEQLPIQGVPTFWDTLASSSQRALLLDYDGTLAPFHVDRMAATPLGGIEPLLDEIASSRNTILAIVSGRPVAEVQQLIRTHEMRIAGTHGWEQYDPAIGVQSPTLTAEQMTALADAYAAAEEIVSRSQIERKIATVAVHTRALDDADARQQISRLRPVWSALSLRSGSEVRDFDGGIEFRLAGRTKGDAVEVLLRGIPESAFAVYIGDDDTDEDAFLVIAKRGIGIRVGAHDRPTAATGRLFSIEEVRQFLCTWINVIS